MYTSIAIILTVAALALANPIPAAPQRLRHLEQPQNNLNPNLFDPVEDKKNNKIYADSMGSKYRPYLSDSEYIDFQGPQGVKKGAIRAGPADPNAADDDVADQNQIMNEISNIIQQNNMKVRNIKNPGVKVELPETPVLNENAKINKQAPMDLAEPIVNVQDTNNGEQFEKLPRINERIPVVNRQIFKVPHRKQRIPIANDNEGIVYNAPKVQERTPINGNKEIKLNDLEDANNVDAVINKLDEHMKQNGEFQSKLHLHQQPAENKMNAESHHGDLIHHDHHHDLHRGADMGKSYILPLDPPV